MKEQEKPQLRKEVAEKYKLNRAAYAGEVNHPKYGMVNLATIDLAKADKLAKDSDFNYLVEIKGSAPASGKADK